MCNKILHCAVRIVVKGVLIGGVGLFVGAVPAMCVAAVTVAGVVETGINAIVDCFLKDDRDTLLRDARNLEAGVNAVGANVAGGLENVNAMQQRVLQEQVRLLEQRMEVLEADAANRREEDNQGVAQRHAAPQLHRRINGRRERGLFPPVPRREAANIEPDNNDALRAGMR